MSDKEKIPAGGTAYSVFAPRDRVLVVTVYHPADIDKRRLEHLHKQMIELATQLVETYNRPIHIVLMPEDCRLELKGEFPVENVQADSLDPSGLADVAPTDNQD